MRHRTMVLAVLGMAVSGLAVLGLAISVSLGQDQASDRASAQQLKRQGPDPSRWQAWQDQAAEICQPPDQPWRTVPWELDLLAAQHRAVEEGKPLFIWAMDGHPLGCT